MSEMSADKPSRGDRALVSGVVGTGLLVIVLLLVHLLSISRHPPHSQRLRCLVNLRQLGLRLSAYAADHDDRYPAPQEWCDALVETSSKKRADIERMFRCAAVKGGPCDYAMNPFADPCSPPDTVLLFESKPGWNESGGPELLTTANHGRWGCSVLLVDGRVLSVKAEEVIGLKWKDQGTLPSEKRDE